MNTSKRYLLQLIGTLLVLAFVPTNAGKLLAFLVLWAVTFRHLSAPEVALAALACVFFSAMNAASLKQGIFVFDHPDLLGMPVYEFFMWGFYLLHTKRVLGGAAPESRRPVIWALAVLYSAAFAAIPNPELLLLATGILLAIGLLLCHERLDLAYVTYMVILGAAIEYTGVHSGQWHYPGNPPGGVPVWFVTLWGGVGFFLRRLVLPIIARYERLPSAAA